MLVGVKEGERGVCEIGKNGFVQILLTYTHTHPLTSFNSHSTAATPNTDHTSWSKDIFVV